MKILLITLYITASLLSASSWAEGDHSDHDHGSENHGSHDSLDSHDDHKGQDDHNEHEAHDDHGHGGGKAIGKGKAIVEVDEKNGFMLSKEAIKTLKIQLKTISNSEFLIEKKNLVTTKDKKGIYRFRNGFFKFVPARIIKEQKSDYKVKIEGLIFGDQFVTNGVGLLRVSDVYSTDKSEYGHSH
ncbi:MAG: hypothetical protein KC493_01670 [Bacteriovoracaceae bacterium]|nr:hypothetical protein [Bacteriovoracaceae bacterium]